MQIESPLPKPIQNKKYIVPTVLRVAIFILFFLSMVEDKCGVSQSTVLEFAKLGSILNLNVTE